MAQLELQQVLCPSCKRSITSFNPFRAEVECPYCHNKAFNPLITSKKIPVPERIIPFATTEQDFEQAFVKELVNGEMVPADIFEHINTGNVVKAYMPMYLYEGNYQSVWNCSVAMKDPKGNIVYQTRSGAGMGMFSFLTLAYEGRDIPDELKTFVARFPYNVINSKEYDPALLETNGETEITTAIPDIDSEVAWAKYGTNLVSEMAKENAMSQIGKVKTKNFQVSPSYDLKTKGKYVLAPFWFCYYQYGNQNCYYLMDGLGTFKNSILPYDYDLEDKIKQVQKKNIWYNVLLIFAIILLFLGFLMSKGAESGNSDNSTGITLLCILVGIAGSVTSAILKGRINTTVFKMKKDALRQRETAAKNL